MKVKPLVETTTSRIYHHLTETDKWAIVSPYRYELSPKENNHRMLKLKQEVRKLGYGYIQFLSRWTEDGITSDEESLFIPNCLAKDAIMLGKQYEQSSVIICNDNSCKMICTTPYEDNDEGDIVQTFNISGKDIMNIEDAKEIFIGNKGGAVSKAKGALPFTLSEVYEVEQPKPSTFEANYRYIRII